MEQKPELLIGKCLIHSGEDLETLLVRMQELVSVLKDPGDAEYSAPDVSGIGIGNVESHSGIISSGSMQIQGMGREPDYLRDTFEQRIRTLQTDLSKANQDIIDLRIAHLNIMEDVAEAGRSVEKTNTKSSRQSKKRKKAVKKLRKSERMFRTLLNASPEAIIKLKLDGRISDFSDLAPGLFGIDNPDSFKEKSIWDLVPPGEQKKLEGIFRDLLNHKEIQSTETRLLKTDGSSFIAELSLTLVEKKNGTPKSYLTIIRDVSDRKKMDVQLIHNARLVSLGEMATGIAHEINQPLNTISLSLDNFLYEINRIESVDKSYFQSKSEKIFDNIYRIKNIIEHIRDFARYQDDHVMVPFDLHKSIVNAISMISEEFRHKEIDLITDYEKSGCYVQGNVFKFEQVILNLLTNAKDALDEKKKQTADGSRSYVKIHTFINGDFIFVAVEDNGCGIENADIEKAFVPFYSTKEEGKGTGLGLSISYGIIREMMGTCEIQSKPGVGTTVLIRLPKVKNPLGSPSESE